MQQDWSPIASVVVPRQMATPTRITYQCTTKSLYMCALYPDSDMLCYCRCATPSPPQKKTRKVQRNGSAQVVSFPTLLPPRVLPERCHRGRATRWSFILYIYIYIICIYRDQCSFIFSVHCDVFFLFAHVCVCFSSPKKTA